MTSRSPSPSPPRPWPARSRGATLVPPVLAVALLAMATVGASVRGHDVAVRNLTGPPMSEVLGYARDPNLPVTYEDARAAGTVGDYDWGERCDTERRYNDTDTTLARLAIPSTYAPPCVPEWDGDRPWVSAGGVTFDDNGGATAPGVTGDTIKIVLYLPAEQDIAKQLEQFGVLDGAAATTQGVEELVAMSNQLYETYGRRVEIVPFHASGDGRSPAAARADAVQVVEMGAFASLGGPSQTSAYLFELARNQVLCIQCGYASTDDVLASAAPYAWGYQATPDQLLFGTFGLGTSMLEGNPAQFAGDPELRSRPRRMGVVHYEQDPPVFGPLKERAVDHFAAEGFSASTIISYILDPNTLNAQAQAIVGRLKREEITTVVFLGDPLMPRLLMQQATRQDYWPEWVFTGTALTDTSAVGRLYDQRQMAHAFGASSNPARTQPELSEPWRMHEWWYGRAPSAPKTMLAWGPVVQLIFLGIHMAGPHLTPETFAGGLFNYPPTGGTGVVGMDVVGLFLGGYLGGDTTPAISFGPRGEGEAVDYVAVDDFTVAWWDPQATGPDEDGTEAPGMWQYSGLGLRLPLSAPTLPAEINEDFLFSSTLSEVGGPLHEAATTLDIGDVQVAEPILSETPPLDTLPTYPPWPESPALTG